MHTLYIHIHIYIYIYIYIYINDTTMTKPRALLLLFFSDLLFKRPQLILRSLRRSPRGKAPWRRPGCRRPGALGHPPPWQSSPAPDEKPTENARTAEVLRSRRKTRRTGAEKCKGIFFGGGFLVVFFLVGFSFWGLSVFAGVFVGCGCLLVFMFLAVSWFWLLVVGACWLSAFVGLRWLALVCVGLCYTVCVGLGGGVFITWLGRLAKCLAIPPHPIWETFVQYWSSILGFRQGLLGSGNNAQEKLSNIKAWLVLIGYVWKLKANS